MKAMRYGGFVGSAPAPATVFVDAARRAVRVYNRKLERRHAGHSGAPLVAFVRPNGGEGRVHGYLEFAQ